MLAYHLDYFNIGLTRKSHEKAAKMLRARGIRGILTRFFPVPMEEVFFPCHKFIGINLFGDPHVKKIPTISSYHAESMEIVLEELLKRGYRHPALIIRRGLSHYLRHGWWMAFVANAGRFSDTSILFSDEVFISETEQAKWAKKQKADVLIYCASENHIPATMLSAVAQDGKMGVVCMDLLNPQCGISGIYQDRFKAGGSAVEWLQSMLIIHQTEAVQYLNAMMVPGTWKEGKTLKSRSLV